MRTAIDPAGRVVIPKQLRDSLGLEAGTELDIAVRNGVIEIEPAPTPMRLRQHGRHLVAEPEGELPTLMNDQVRDILEQVRR